MADQLQANSTLILPAIGKFVVLSLVRPLTMWRTLRLGLCSRDAGAQVLLIILVMSHSCAQVSRIRVVSAYDCDLL